MRSSIIILILFFLAERSIAKQPADECPFPITGLKKVNCDTLPQKNTMQPYRCSTEQPAEINLKEWTSCLEKNLLMDSASSDTIPEGIYRAFVQFVVDKEGKINDVKIEKDPGYGLGERIVSTVSQCKGCWEPAKQNGRLVRSFQRQPITFIVEKECIELYPSELIL
jgi:hypothetical protein